MVSKTGNVSYLCLSYRRMNEDESKKAQVNAGCSRICLQIKKTDWYFQYFRTYQYLTLLLVDKEFTLLSTILICAVFNRSSCQYSFQKKYFFHYIYIYFLCIKKKFDKNTERRHV